MAHNAEPQAEKRLSRGRYRRYVDKTVGVTERAHLAELSRRLGELARTGRRIAAQAREARSFNT